MSCLRRPRLHHVTGNPDEKIASALVSSFDSFAGQRVMIKSSRMLLLWDGARAYIPAESVLVHDASVHCESVLVFVVRADPSRSSGLLAVRSRRRRPSQSHHLDGEWKLGESSGLLGSTLSHGWSVQFVPRCVPRLATSSGPTCC